MGENPSPDISVVVAVRNVENHVVTVLRSAEAAARATGRPSEIIAVDDFSEDQTVALIRNRCPDVRLMVNPEPQGRACALNRGIEQSLAPVVVLVEGATTVPVELFRILVTPILESREAHPDCPVVAVGAGVLGKGEETSDAAPEEPHWGLGGVFPVDRADGADGESSFVRLAVGAVDRERFLQLGGFEPLYQSSAWQDRDWTFRATRAGWRCLCVSEPVAEQWRPLGPGDDVTDRIRPRVRERSRIWFNWLNLRGFFLLTRQVCGLVMAILLGTGAMGVARLSILGAFVPALLWPGQMLRARKRRVVGDPEPCCSVKSLIGLDRKGKRRPSEGDA